MVNLSICEWWGAKQKKSAPAISIPFALLFLFSSQHNISGWRWKDLLDSLSSIGQALSGVLSVKILRFHLNLKQTCRLRERGSRVFRETEKELFLKYLTRSLSPRLIEGNLADGSGFVSSQVRKSDLERKSGHLWQPLVNAHIEIFQPNLFLQKCIQPRQLRNQWHLDCSSKTLFL